MEQFNFSNKTIFLFSPEQWGNMKLSKHHYALQLSSKGNKVFFLEPANGTSEKVSVKEITANLAVVNYPLKARGWGKLPGWLYRKLVKREMNFLVNAVGHEPDVIWNFDPLKLVHMSSFKSALKIYHPVDQFETMFLTRYPVSPQVCFSTMEKEVALLREAGFTAHFINHGLSDIFVNYTRSRLQDLRSGKWSNECKDNLVRVGFAGNLLGEAPDREVMQSIIMSNKDCHFHFWGKTNNEENYLQLGSYHPEFIEFLKHQENVSLHGVVATEVLAEQMQAMNMFWIFWKDTGSPQWNRHTNPHKIMEYLSTGVPVVSHFMETYAGKHLIEMIQAGEKGKDFERLFEAAKSKLRKGGAGTLHECEKRMEFALDQTYARQVERIEGFLEKMQTVENVA